MKKSSGAGAARNRSSRAPVEPDGRSGKRVRFRCGVYAVVHEATARVYVGSSVEVEKRLYWHVSMLRAGKHHCQYLQRVWAKYGEAGFTYYLLEECATDALAAREQYHMDNPGRYTLMNGQPVARSARGYIHTPETRARMSEAAKRIAADPDERKRRAERARRQHAAGLIPHDRRPLSPRKCRRCGEEFERERHEDGTPKQHKDCPGCRRPQHGGRKRRT